MAARKDSPEMFEAFKMADQERRNKAQGPTEGQVEPAEGTNPVEEKKPETSPKRELPPREDVLAPKAQVPTKEESWASKAETQDVLAPKAHLPKDPAPVKPAAMREEKASKAATEDVLSPKAQVPKPEPVREEPKPAKPAQAKEEPKFTKPAQAKEEPKVAKREAVKEEPKKEEPKVIKQQAVPRPVPTGSTGSGMRQASTAKTNRPWNQTGMGQEAVYIPLGKRCRIVLAMSYPVAIGAGVVIVAALALTYLLGTWSAGTKGAAVADSGDVYWRVQITKELNSDRGLAKLTDLQTELEKRGYKDFKMVPSTSKKLMWLLVGQFSNDDDGKNAAYALKRKLSQEVVNGTRPFTGPDVKVLSGN